MTDLVDNEIFEPATPEVDLRERFPTVIPDVERRVFDAVKQGTEDGLPTGVPGLSFYSDKARAVSEGRKVPVGLGWPAYPGKVPAIGVASGPETEDQQHQTEGGGFAGTAYAYDRQRFPTSGGLRFPDTDEWTPAGISFETDDVVGTANYFAQPLYAPVIVELIHENRDERDRLHNELRRILFPLRDSLLRSSPLIRRVGLDSEKTEENAGPPVAEQPLWVYISIFTVHVYYEMLEARDVAGADSVVGAIDVAVPVVDTSA